MHIVHIASELAPIAKVGGLADVLMGLCRELSWKGHDIDIILPKYDCIDSNNIRDLTVAYPNLLSFYEGQWHNNTIWVGWVENLKVYFVEPHHNRYFFNRGCFYGCEDDMERFLYFSRTALEFLYKQSIQPDILHIHDWQSAVVAPLYKDMYNGLSYNKPKVVFTIHNIEYQGRCRPSDLDKIGLKGDTYLTPERMQDPLHTNEINLVKGAIVYSDIVTTVSPNYAKEVKTPEGGRGLEKVIIQNQDKFIGILNGIDYSYWNPEIDRYLPVHFSSRERQSNKKDYNTLDKKGYVKKLLRDRLMLEDDHRPLIGCITRLVPQKGVDLIKHAITYASKKNGQLILLGSSPIPSINEDFQALKHEYTDHPNISLILHYNEELSHWIYAASDMFIVPSLFEPCGLTQMIALKYGSIPIARNTGGLADSIFDVDYSGKSFDETNGYIFDLPEVNAFESALDRAFDCWFHHPDRWRKLMVNGMNIDFSWNVPAGQYLEIYKKLKDKASM